MKKTWLTTAVLAAALAASLTACSGGAKETTAAQTEAQATEAGSEAETEASEAEETTAAAGELQKIVVGASPAPHAEILAAAKDVLLSKGYELEIVEYTDYVQPNNALDSGDLDANYFQHKPYLDSFNQQNGTKLVSAGAIHYEPFGIYAGKSTSLDAVPEKGTVLVPNDVSNEARALLLLEAQGLIKLKDGVGLEATKNDIVENPKNLDIVELEAAQLPRSLADGDIAVINGNYAIEAGLKVSDALATEDSQSLAATTYGNVVAVREGDEETPATKALVEALTSPEVKQFMEDTYEGAVVPLF
ncbi:MetQ/NlpA family ABC transporter substrate-binding protein [Lacrimispora sp. 210928-DFI.3.58]|uniref:MetQ/NlpA family ABC transporter substrate-binding protein n=1 Tax=Lacrimispora sp. 210928-DFI.3.58 TaxID=2883214 RepID=UPI0015B7304B|nr:MetQ/NlpA family ABC transporter substrate-binding protein [Lacrimispora sp. 210928-DFI.3.58]MCB7321288.1 MetQ/NlpA family ABC transporter substrate-binding protein [Lacrimispora sp. 210928-DFI.3.58]